MNTVSTTNPGPAGTGHAPRLRRGALLAVASVARGRRADVGLQTGDGERQHLDVDARRVHLRQPVLGEVGELAGPVRQVTLTEPVRGPRRGLPAGQFGNGECFFQSDVSHLGSLSFLTVVRSLADRRQDAVAAA